jgi:hypothetical protein
MSEIINLQSATKPTFDPNKQYTWTEDTTFIIKGGEFGLILNTLRAAIATPEAQIAILANDANKTLTEVLAKAVEDGIVKEMETEETPKNSL